MAEYRREECKALLENIIAHHISGEALGWLKEKAANPGPLPATFAAIPRKTGKKMIVPAPGQREQLNSLLTGFSVDGWTADRLARVWLIASIDASDKEPYIQSIEKLFQSADVNESVALYSALPVLEYPEAWTARCAIGIRSSIDDVLAAIMCKNPYPSRYLDDNAWNQLVLKAFFTNTPTENIVGIDARANERLARTLSDYAHERWAAHREVNPQIWRQIGKFIDTALFADIEALISSGAPQEKEAALLACFNSNYPPAQELLNKNESIRSAIASGKLTWDKLAEKKTNYVLQQ